jgi:acetyl-CoA acetyltransferase
MRDVAIIAFASVAKPRVEESEVQMLFPVVNEAIEQSGIPRREIGFTCSASCDYLAGAPFSFVSNLEATGAWPPIAESHVEQDGAWAMYEAWVRLQDGDIDTALVFSSGQSSKGKLREVFPVQLDPYYLTPLFPDHVSIAALQARALIDSGRHTEEDFAAVAARGDGRTPDVLLKEPYVVAPLRAHDCPPVTDGAAAVVLAVGDKAREVCSRPAWIRGLDHRSDPHYLGVRDLATSTSARIAGERAGVGKAKVDVAELSAMFSHEELILRDALGLSNGTDVNPSGGALKSNPIMSAGLIRIGEAFRAINQRRADRAVGHASSGPALQQNLVCVLEGEN